MNKRLLLTLAAVLMVGVLVVAGVALVTAFAPQIAVQASALSAADRNAGILVGAVEADSPAAKAGLVRGDIITAVNGTTLDAKSNAMTLLKDAKVGDVLKLSVLHGDDERSVEVTLADQNGKPYLGIGIAVTMPVGKLRAFNGDLAKKIINGAHVTEVTAGGPAEKAGIKVGDTITKVGDKDVDASNDLATLVQAYKPGDSVTLTVTRSGEANALSIKVTLGDNPDKAGQAYLGLKYNSFNMPGLPQGLTPRGKDNGNGNGNNGTPPANPRGFNRGEAVVGVVVNAVKAGSPADTAGLKAKDVITAANDKSVANAADFAALVKGLKPGDKLALTVTRSGETKALTITVTLGENPDKAGEAYLGITYSMGRGLPQNGTPAKPQVKGSNS